jgi:hypothetical protein
VSDDTVDGIDDGGPAFPAEFETVDSKPGFRKWCGTPGMSLRDYFAGQALATMKLSCWSDNPLYWEGVARSAYVCADEMLKARKVR